MIDPVLSLRGLSVTLHRDRAAIRAVDGVDLDLAPGGILALVGESGSGKSTLGMAVLGLLPPEARPVVEGSIRLAGEELVGRRDRVARELRRRAVRAVFQDALGALNPGMRVGAQMAEDAPDRAEALDWLARVDLPDPERIFASYPHQLSGGQRQRVLIAMAMSADPTLLIADEPTTALDVTVQGQVLALLRRLAREKGTSVIFVTHDLAVAATLADRVAVLYGGRLAEIGPTRGLLDAPAHPYTAGLLAARFDLDHDTARPLPTLPGEPQSGGGRPGCAFAPRCAMAEPACDVGPLPLGGVPQHAGRSACRRAAEVRPARNADLAPWPPAPRDDAVVLQFDAVGHDYRLPRALPFTRSATLPALRDVSFALRAGEALAVVGESGSGKSTLLRIAAGLLLPDTGRVTRAGGSPPQMIHQDAVASFTPWLTIGEQISERLRPLRLSAAEMTTRLDRALADAGLPGAAAAFPSELSGGQAQRAAIARAIVVPPQILLCDEPVSAMDVSLAAQTLNLVGAMRRRLGMAIVFVTHDLVAARIVADRILVMRAGRVVEEGPAARITRAPASDYARSLLAAMPRLAREDAV